MYWEEDDYMIIALCDKCAVHVILLEEDFLMNCVKQSYNKEGGWELSLRASLCLSDATLSPCSWPSPLSYLAGKAENQLQKSISWIGDAPNDGKVVLIASRGVLCFVSPPLLTTASVGHVL